MMIDEGVWRSDGETHPKGGPPVPLGAASLASYGGALVCLITGDIPLAATFTHAGNQLAAIATVNAAMNAVTSGNAGDIQSVAFDVGKGIVTDRLTRGAGPGAEAITNIAVDYGPAALDAMFQDGGGASRQATYKMYNQP